MSGQRPCGVSLDARGAAGRPPWVRMLGSCGGYGSRRALSSHPSVLWAPCRGLNRGAPTQVGACPGEVGNHPTLGAAGKPEGSGLAALAEDIPAWSRVSVPSHPWAEDTGAERLAFGKSRSSAT